MPGNEVIASMVEEMASSIEALKKELVKVRTGRASAALLDSVQVDYYGSNVPVNQVANITTPDARTLQIVPWEANTIGAVEKAILAANLGFTPQNDGKLIRIPMPPLTEERRKEMVKGIKKMGEECKISIRNHRRDCNEAIKQQEKDKAVSQDDAKKLMEQVQKETDGKIAQVDELVVSKEKEVMTV